MSRSFKKTGCFSDYSKKRTKWYKRYASKSVRRFNGDISHGSGYKKIFESYAIRDFKFLVFSSYDLRFYKGEEYKAFMKWLTKKFPYGIITLSKGGSHERKIH